MVQACSSWFACAALTLGGLSLISTCKKPCGVFWVPHRLPPFDVRCAPTFDILIVFDGLELLRTLLYTNSVPIQQGWVLQFKNKIQETIRKPTTSDLFRSIYLSWDLSLSPAWSHFVNPDRTRTVFPGADSSLAWFVYRCMGQHSEFESVKSKKRTA